MPDDRTQQKKIKASDITGLKYFDKLAPLLRALQALGYAPLMTVRACDVVSTMDQNVTRE